MARAKELNKLLVECNFPSICIHRGMKQEERLDLLVHCTEPDRRRSSLPHRLPPHLLSDLLIT